MRLISIVCAFLLLAGIPVGAAPAEEVRLHRRSHWLAWG